jgi:hypothetical protein
MVSEVGNMDPRVVFALMIILAFGGILLYEILRRIGQRESPERRAGRLGEVLVSDLINDVLNADDHLLTNVRIKADGKETELDNLIINSYGIFIVEVKNYNGTLYGDSDDYEWTKIKINAAGYSFVSQVKNPIKQVKRQIYILSQFLKQHGYHIWIEGYVFFVRGNCPIADPCVLHNEEEIDKVLHQGNKTAIDDIAKERIIKLLLGSRNTNHK